MNCQSATKIFLFLFTFLTISINAQTGYDEPDQFVTNKLIVKIKPGKYISSEEALHKSFAFAGISNVTKLFKQNSVQTDESQILENLYTITYNSPYSPNYVIGKVSGNKLIEYVEPINICKISADSPNDPNYAEGMQWNLTKINAEQAWDITRGSSDIIIAIVDTGIDFNHEDLIANKASVPGYDFGSGDDDPTEDDPVHGTYIAGVASAVTNNGIGNASIGYNTKLMAIKVTEGNSKSFPFPFDAIKYAVDNGADIINCSFTSYKYSRAEQELMNYAAEHGVLVVASAGNDNKPTAGYPAAYNNVLAVTATDTDDSRWSQSNYGYNVDVAAPGVDIYSTWWAHNEDSRDYSYRLMNGSSQAAALVSGLAALVKSKYPDYSPRQIAEQVRVTSKSINSVTDNKIYKNLLGYGRINAYEALSNINAKSVRPLNIEIVSINTGNEIIQPNDTFEVKIDFKNYLAPVSNLSIKLRINNNYATTIDSTFEISSLSSGGEFSNTESKFKFSVSSSVPENEEIEFVLIFSGNEYSDYYGFYKTANPTFQTQYGGSIAVSLTNSGRIGFDKHGDPPQIGEGIIFNDGTNILFEGAFMYGNSSTLVADNAHKVYLASSENDFLNVEPFTIGTDDAFADYTGKSSWKEKTTILGINTKFISYTYDNAPNDKFILLNYSLENNGALADSTSSTLDSVYVGLFFDWDIPGINTSNWLRDIAVYDSVNNFIYAYDIDGDSAQNSIYVGAAFLNEEGTNVYPINNNGSDGDIIVDDADRALISFTKAEKWKTLSSGTNKKTSGIGDISFVISGGPFSIDSSSDSAKTFSFALAADNSLVGLQNAIVAARKKIDSNIPIETKIEIPESPRLSQNYPNPFNPETIIEYQIINPGKVVLRVFDILGRQVATLVNKKQSAGYYKVRFGANNLASGVYIYNIVAPNFVESKKMILLR